MAQFLDTSGISFEIENIVKNARNELVLISPYLRLSKTLFERLKDTERNGVKNIILIYGKDELRPDEKSQLRRLKNLSLRFFVNLHAKCYYNQDSMVITSMNMHEFSEKNNREMGILIRKEGSDSEVFSAAKKEAESILAHSRLDEKENVFVETFKKAAKSIAEAVEEDEGHCIMCGASMADRDYDEKRPLCNDCYPKWARHKNPNETEKYCYQCGKPAPTTMNKPLCLSCFKKVSR
ncbi:MAG: hypothetical protein HYX85_02165 [Chloroflexi bacterium]|nr:hypothetical protein [Chloroflexota bacterium]